MSNLTDEDRDVLTWAIANHGCNHTGRVNHDAPTGCGDCWRIAEEGVLPAVERIVTRHRAQAWDEGVSRGIKFASGIDPSSPVNPYREGDQ